MEIKDLGILEESPGTLETASESPARASCVSVPTALYRHFSKGGELLYIGIALSPTYRLTKHNRTAHWYTEIATIKVEWFPSRQEALEEERYAINSEFPKHNTRHRLHESRRAGFEAVQKLTEWAKG